MTESDLLKVASHYSEHRSVSLKTVGLYAADDGKFFTRLADGKSCTLKRANNILGWFDQNWPDDLNWPADIPRPAPKRQDAA